MKYGVTFIQYHYYEVEAESEDEARVLADDEFYNDMCMPIANTHYDAWEIEELEEEEEEDW